MGLHVCVPFLSQPPYIGTVMSVENNNVASANNSQGHTITLNGEQVSGLFINITAGSQASTVSPEQLAKILKNPEVELVITPFTKKSESNSLQNLLADEDKTQAVEEPVVAPTTATLFPDAPAEQAEAPASAQV